MTFVAPPPSWATKRGGWYGGGSALSPALALVLNGSVPLDPRVTFSRTTPAMVYDSTGQLTWGANNLVGQSQNFTAYNAGLTRAYGVTDPAGGTTAVQLTCTSANQNFYSGGTATNANVINSIYIRRVTGTGVVNIIPWDNTAYVAVVPTSVWQRFATGPRTSASGGYIGVSMGTAGDVIEVAFVQAEAVTYQTTPRTYIVSSSGNPVYGARFDYDPATATLNQFQRSQELDNAYWLKSNVSIIANDVAAPDGTTTAERVTVASTGTFRGFTVFAGLPAVSGKPFTTSISAKAGTNRYLALEMDGGNGYAWFDLQAGTVLSTSGNTVGTIVSQGNGWYRCSATRTATTTGSPAYRLVDGDGVYSATSGNYLYLWGAQYETSGFAGPYVATTAAAAQNFASSLGMLIEEQRVNSVTYSQALDNAAWTKVAASVTANAALGPDGTTTAGLLVPDTTNASHRAVMAGSLTTTAIACSFYAKASGYTQVGIRENWTTGASVAFTLSGAGSVTTPYNAGVATISNATIVALPNGWYRCSCVITCSSSTQQSMAICALNGSYASGDLFSYNYVGDGTSGVLLWGAQLEAGSFATSYIPTTSASVTRAADVASMTGTNFSSWYNQSAGTFVFEADWLATSNYAYPLVVSTNGARAQDYGIFCNPAALLSFEIDTASVSQGSGNGNAVSVASPRKVAFAYATGDYSFVDTGQSPQLKTPGTLPTPDRVFIGARSDGFYLNGHIKSLTYYSTRLPDATLQSLTSYTPDIDWDLTTAIPPGATFTRASTATYTDVNGVLQTAASGAPRFDYSGGVAKGLLIEEARTNLVLRSQEFDNAAWTSPQQVVVTANQATAPDGTLTADKIAEDTTTAVHSILQIITTTASVAYTGFVYVKDIDLRYVQLSLNDSTTPTTWVGAVFDLTNGTTSGTAGSGGGTFTSSKIDAVGNGWYRIQVTGTVGAATAVRFILSLANDGTISSADDRGRANYLGSGKSIYLWGAQMELGSFATSYIPTTSAAVTRAADSCVVSGPAFASWWTGTRGTINLTVDTAAPSGGNPYFFQIDDGTANNRIISYRNGTANQIDFASVGGGSPPIGLGNFGSLVAGIVGQKIATSFAINSVAAVLAGGTVSSGTNNTLPPNLNRLALGYYPVSGIQYLNGHLSRFQFYKSKRLPNSTLQRLST